MPIANVSLGATTSASASKAASISVTPSAAPTNTDTLVAVGGCHTSGTGSFSDNGSPANTYTVQVTNVNTVQADLGTVLSVGGSPTTITYTNTAAKGKIAICLAEYSGVTGFGTTGTGSGSTSPASVTVTTQHPNDWLVGGGTNNSTGTLTAGASTNNRSTDTANQDTWVFDSGAVATPASTTLNETLGTPAAWATVAILLSGVQHLTASQPVTTATSIVKTVTKPVSQPISVLTTGIFTRIVSGLTLTVTQPITSATSLVKTITKPVSQSLTAATSISKVVTKLVSQSITIGSSGVFLRTRFLTVTQPVTVGASVIKTVVKILSQSATVATSVSKVITKPLSQATTVGSSGVFLRTSILTVTQPVTVSTSVVKIIVKIFSQGVTVATRYGAGGPSLFTVNVTQPIRVNTWTSLAGQVVQIEIVTTIGIQTLVNRYRLGFFWGSTPPQNPAVGAVWMDTVAIQLKKWTGVAWVAVP